MRIVENWSELMYDELHCLKSSTAKRQFRNAIRYAFGGLCAYCRSQRATTLDHLKPRCKGGDSLRSNLLPACLECNHSKGSEDWLNWYSNQKFYSEVGHELIQEWIENKGRLVDYDERTEHRAEVCTHKSKVRSNSNEQARTRKSRSKITQITDGTEERGAKYVTS